MALAKYRAKRDFSLTREPKGENVARAGIQRSHAGSFVIHKHDATRLHYDLRLEVDGVYKSWAVPKGPSLDPSEKCLAVEVEDHPLEYGAFEGTIPKGQYGGGTVMAWDRGEWRSVTKGSPSAALKAGHLKFSLNGTKLHGEWTLIRMKSRAGETKNNWLLVKAEDEWARVGRKGDVRISMDTSVDTGRSMDEIAAGAAVATGTDKLRATKKNAKTKSEPERAPSSHRKVPEAAPAEGAVREERPRELTPQLAVLGKGLPEGSEWVHEIKFDGYRLLAHVEGGTVSLITRSGKDWTARFASLAKDLEGLGLPDCIIDGEAVVLNEAGVSDFGALQGVLSGERTGTIHFYAFDLPWLSGWNLQACTLASRRALLQPLVSGKGRIRFSENIEGEGAAIMQHACRLHLEGIISKRVDSVYESKRSGTWIKTKCGGRQEMVIAGFTPPQRSRSSFGALLMGVYAANGEFVFAGKVGTGFSEAVLATLGKKMKGLAVAACPFAEVPRGPGLSGITWIEPKLVAEVAFAEWTSDGKLRQPVFHGLREDKDAKAVRREVVGKDGPEVKPMPKKNRARKTALDAAMGGVVITHPERVVFPSLGLTKADVAEYYERVMDHFLPFVVNRPLSLVRCPGGSEKGCFFQKRLTHPLAGVKSISIKDAKGTQPAVVVESAEGVMSLVQNNVLEFHAWGSTMKDPEKADHVVFDLDPGPGVDASAIAETAKMIRGQLEALELESFLLVSGGKGLHVVAPLRPPVDFAIVKPFAKAIADGLAETHPDALTSTLSKAARGGKIFIDYLRNGRGATSIVPFSTRNRAAASVAVPIPWSAVARTAPDAYTLAEVPAMLKRRKVDPWAEYFTIRQTISARMKASLSQSGKR